MTAALKGLGPAETADGKAMLALDDAILLRIAAATATRADLQRDLLAAFGPALSGTAFRRASELAISQLTSKSFVLDAKGRLCVSSEGAEAAARHPLLAQFDNGSLGQGWAGVRSALAISALPITAPATLHLKAAGRADSLAALIVQAHFGLPVHRAQSANALRGALAVVALERAFGNKIKTGLGKGTGLPGKAGRVLAGQLLNTPRDFTSDGKLILALAVELTGAKDGTVEALQIALLRRLTAIMSTPSDASRDAVSDRAAAPAPRPARRQERLPSADNDPSPAPLEGLKRATAAPADLEEFSQAVIEAARPVSEGWPGNRKAFISLVWQAIRNSRPNWRLSEVAFKSMLTEAHRTGSVVLASADLKGRADLKELEDSKILYKNTVWHFVRVED
jgi:hypothetical protein